MVSSSSGMCWAEPVRASISGNWRISWSNISCTGSTATTVAPVANRRGENLPVPRGEVQRRFALTEPEILSQPFF